MVIYFKYSSVYVSIPNSHSLPPLPSSSLVTINSFSKSVSLFVTKNTGQLLATQKPIKRSNWWTGKLAFFWMLATGRVGGRHLSKAQLPQPLTISGQELLETEGGGFIQKAQSALTVALKLVIGGLTIIILIVLSTVDLQFQVWFVSIPMRPVLRIMAVYVMATVWSSCS